MGADLTAGSSPAEGSLFDKPPQQSHRCHIGVPYESPFVPAGDLSDVEKCSYVSVAFTFQN